VAAKRARIQRNIGDLLAICFLSRRARKKAGRRAEEYSARDSLGQIGAEDPGVSDPLFVHRLQFSFTIVYHYLFPVLTMGLALLIAIMKGLGLARGGERWNDAARFWIRIFGITFAVGVVTGIPMEFQFGTNWARFSRYAGNVVGQTLAMESFFAFFLESTFSSCSLYGERRLREGPLPRGGGPLFWAAGCRGTITATNAFMQHPWATAWAGRRAPPRTSGAFLGNPWAQYAHNADGPVETVRGDGGRGLLPAPRPRLEPAPLPDAGPDRGPDGASPRPSRRETGRRSWSRAISPPPSRRWRGGSRRDRRPRSR
jgi:hypothetical protein